MDTTETLVLVMVASLGAFFISSVAGYGGSLLLVPVLIIAVGPKEGVALAALLLACNNFFKLIAYRRSLALGVAWPIVVVAVAGVFIGTQLLIAAPQGLVVWGVSAIAVATFVVEVARNDSLLTWRRRFAVPIMLTSGVFSGLSGVSGPLKGVAVRSLGLPRLQHVGVLSVISLAGDALKSGLLADAGYLAAVNPALLFVTIPMMPIAAWSGRFVNERIHEDSFRVVFWAVVAGYTFRMLGIWA